MSSLSAFKRPSNVELHNKIVAVINDQANPEDIHQFLEEAPLLEAAQMYVEGFRYQNYINYPNWAQRLSERLKNVQTEQRDQIFEELMSSFYMLGQYSYEPNDYEYFYATWDIPGFKEHAQNILQHKQAENAVYLLVARLGEYFGNEKIIPNQDIVPQLKQIQAVAESLDVDFKSVIENVSQRDNMSSAAVVGMYEYFNWELQTLSPTALDNVFKNGTKEDVQKVVDHVPTDMLTQNNGSLLYRVLRGYDLTRDTANTQHTMAGVPVLLKHIDYIQCLKSRFHEVSPTERLNVSANLAPFLSADEQEKLFALLEDSLARTKNKRDVKELKDSKANKAIDFKNLWDQNNLRKKMKEETSHIQSKTATRKM